jgi:hypothetical protein
MYQIDTKKNYEEDFPQIFCVVVYSFFHGYNIHLIYFS